MFGNLFTQYQKRIAHRRLCIIGTVDCALLDWTEFGKVVYSEKT